MGDMALTLRNIERILLQAQPQPECSPPIPSNRAVFIIPNVSSFFAVQVCHFTNDMFYACLCANMERK
jgi:hypothetical protein